MRGPAEAMRRRPFKSRPGRTEGRSPFIRKCPDRIFPGVHSVNQRVPSHPLSFSPRPLRERGLGVRGVRQADALSAIRVPSRSNGRSVPFHQKVSGPDICRSTLGKTSCPVPVPLDREVSGPDLTTASPRVGDRSANQSRPIRRWRPQSGSENLRADNDPLRSTDPERSRQRRLNRAYHAEPKSRIPRFYVRRNNEEFSGRPTDGLLVELPPPVGRSGAMATALSGHASQDMPTQSGPKRWTWHLTNCDGRSTRPASTDCASPRIRRIASRGRRGLPRSGRPFADLLLETRLLALHRRSVRRLAFPARN